jgi:internalin A
MSIKNETATVKRAKQLIRQYEESNEDLLYFGYLDLCDEEMLQLLPELIGLRNLVAIDLNNNNLTNYDFLKDLINLTRLNLSSNSLTDISFLKELKGLTSLNLNNNNLTDVSFLKELESLSDLHLSNNNLMDVSFLKALKSLILLNLDNNNLSNIDSLKEHKKLEILLLGSNIELEAIISSEVINDWNHPQRIINHYFKVKDGRPINEAKIIVVGEADYGKTLLVNRLVNDTFIKTNRTHGIIVTTWKDVEVNEEKVKLNIWDFGGQKIMQNTHQYFFTERTIYIIVLNARQNESSNKTIEHLERIKSVTKDSPIIVVGNKVDQNKGEFDINRSELREKYNIKGFYGICSDKSVKENVKQYDKNFAEFKVDLIKEIA